MTVSMIFSFGSFAAKKTEIIKVKPEVNFLFNLSCGPVVLTYFGNSWPTFDQAEEIKRFAEDYYCGNSIFYYV